MLVLIPALSGSAWMPCKYYVWLCHFLSDFSKSCTLLEEKDASCLFACLASSHHAFRSLCRQKTCHNPWLQSICRWEKEATFLRCHFSKAKRRLVYTKAKMVTANLGKGICCVRWVKRLLQLKAQPLQDERNGVTIMYFGDFCFTVQIGNLSGLYQIAEPSALGPCLLNLKWSVHVKDEFSGISVCLWNVMYSLWMFVSAKVWLADTIILSAFKTAWESL